MLVFWPQFEQNYRKSIGGIRKKAIDTPRRHEQPGMAARLKSFLRKPIRPVAGLFTVRF
jgi:hypothetical protein